MEHIQVRPSKWTKSAIECYNKGCNCKKCNIPDIVQTPCYMKKTVIELVRLYGKPPAYLEEMLDKQYN